ncbi:hypothetical protein, partial [Rubritalea tangerina]|uniref:hypothetical protein n=1 Tax=Rubritalea tangerina TaxID=430798 RepID=UPI0036199CFB
LAAWHEIAASPECFEGRKSRYWVHSQWRHSVRVKWFARFVIPNRISKKTNVDCGRLDAMRYTKEG